VKEIDRFVPITEAKTHLLDLVRTLKENDEVVVITRGGVPVAVLITPNRWEGLLETIDILSDEKAMASLRRSIKQARAGQWIEHDEVFKEE
jgi:antitoxin YefM